MWIENILHFWYRVVYFTRMNLLICKKLIGNHGHMRTMYSIRIFIGTPRMSYTANNHWINEFRDIQGYEVSTRVESPWVYWVASFYFDKVMLYITYIHIIHFEESHCWCSCYDIEFERIESKKVLNFH